MGILVVQVGKKTGQVDRALAQDQKVLGSFLSASHV